MRTILIVLAFTLGLAGCGSGSATGSGNSNGGARGVLHEIFHF